MGANALATGGSQPVSLPENYAALTPDFRVNGKLARMWGRIADMIVLAVAAAIALFAIVAVSNSHPAGNTDRRSEIAPR